MFLSWPLAIWFSLELTNIVGPDDSRALGLQLGLLVMGGNRPLGKQAESCSVLFSFNSFVTALHPLGHSTVYIPGVLLPRTTRFPSKPSSCAVFLMPSSFNLPVHISTYNPTGLQHYRSLSKIPIPIHCLPGIPPGNSSSSEGQHCPAHSALHFPGWNSAWIPGGWMQPGPIR